MSNLLDSSLVTGLLDAGGWSTTADDTLKAELLPENVVRSIVSKYEKSPADQSAIAAAGMLVLTLAIGRWGISWTSKPAPKDPDGREWKGPSAVEVGKHLMSYTIGGIGLPHLDTGSAIAFFAELGKRIPAAKADLDQLIPNFVYDRIRNEGGKRWEILKVRALEGLRRRDMQEWILEYWLHHYWMPAYVAVMEEKHGSLLEAFVVGRIWNTSKGEAQSALSAARGKTTVQARIDAELASYNNPRRAKTMLRPGVAYEFCRSLVG